MSDPISSANPTGSGRSVQPQNLRDRSRSSGFDLVKLLISLSTGGVATYFIALTEPPKPSLSDYEKAMVSCSMIFMVGAVLIGLIGWGLDAAFFRYWAKSLESTGHDAEKFWRIRGLLNNSRLWAMRLMAVLFALGVIGSGLYVVQRSKRSVQEVPSVGSAGGAGTTSVTYALATDGRSTVNRG